MHKEELLSLADFIIESIKIIKRRFDSIKTPDDFYANDRNLDLFDAICMRLQAIGESIKGINKIDNLLLLKFGDKNYWSSIIKMREIISHRYIDIDAEIVFDICRNEMDKLLIKSEAIMKSLETEGQTGE
ncbi:MAG: hypothetical protein IEMM0003_0735 [bacterium]|nr:MAG: hypothetical protein IEMM0003_0735 [bacterium]